jgi:hypothetical protein
MQPFWRLPAHLCATRQRVQKNAPSSSSIAERATKFRLKADVPHVDELVAFAPRSADVAQSQRKAIQVSGSDDPRYRRAQDQVSESAA